MKMIYSDVLIKPVITEKATALREQDKYVFKVNPSANKTQIKRAVASLFNVTVVDCKTMNVDGKSKMFRGKAGKTSSYKKAIVKLAKGQRIDIFEGV